MPRKDRVEGRVAFAAILGRLRQSSGFLRVEKGLETSSVARTPLRLVETNQLRPNRERITGNNPNNPVPKSSSDEGSGVGVPGVGMFASVIAIVANSQKGGVRKMVSHVGPQKSPSPESVRVMSPGVPLNDQLEIEKSPPKKAPPPPLANQMVAPPEAVPFEKRSAVIPPNQS